MKQLLTDILLNPYKDYMYSYPHKKAYREFDKHIDLKGLWKKSTLSNITLYIHIPFCINKCGYCNLLSSTNFDKCKITKYVDKLIEEIKEVREFLNIKEKEVSFSSVIFGGGTPTILDDFDLKRLLDEISVNLKIDFSKVFFSTEISPRTITRSKLDILKHYHVDRVSMGIQSFKESELKSIYRMESVEDIEHALKLLSEGNIPIKNLDLIYGIPNQTLETWERSLYNTLQYEPEEIYIYPIYIREKTGLYRRSKRDIDLMLRMYEFGKKLLTDKSYIQTSMRNFIRKDMKNSLFPEYSCQEDEMIGIGCGARSYVANVHYSRKYAVEPKNINKIIDDYINEEDFKVAKYGYILNEDELKRRYILKSILKVSGLDICDYNEKFNTSSLEEFKHIAFLIENGFLIEEDNRLYPTEKGLMHSDSIGNLLISEDVSFKTNDFKE